MAEKKVEGLFWTESRTEARKRFTKLHGDPRKYVDDLTDNFLMMLDQEAELDEPFATALKQIIESRWKYLDPLESGRAQEWTPELYRQLIADVTGLMSSGECGSKEAAYTLLRDKEPYKGLGLKPNKQAYKNAVDLLPNTE